MPDPIAELQAALAEPSTPPPVSSSNPVEELRRALTAPMAVSAAPTDDELAVIAGAPPNRPAFSLKPAAPPIPVEPQGPPPLRLGSAKTGGGATAIKGTFPILNSAEEGIPQFGRGARNLLRAGVVAASPEGQPAFGATAPPGGAMAALSDIIEGGMKTAEPAMVAGALVNPVATLAGLAGGIAGQRAASAGVGALGGSPEASRLAGNVTGLVTGGVAAHGAGVGKARIMDALRPSVEPAARVAEPANVITPETIAAPIEELRAPLQDPREPAVEQAPDVSPGVVATEGVKPPPPVLDPEAQAVRDQTAAPGADVVDRIREKMAAGEPLGSLERRQDFAERQRVDDARKAVAANPVEELRAALEQESDHAVPQQSADERGVLGSAGPGDAIAGEEVGARNAEPQAPADARLEGPSPQTPDAEAEPPVSPENAAPPPHVRDLDPAHVREIRRIVHELDAAGYTDTTWNDLSTEEGVNDGNAGGGAYDRRPRVAGAAVYNDIYNTEKTPGTSKASRGIVQAQLERYLAGRGKPTQAVQGAIEIARLRMEGKLRIPGDGKLSTPELPRNIGDLPTRLEPKAPLPEPLEEEGLGASSEAEGEGDVDNLGDWFKQQADADSHEPAQGGDVEDLGDWFKQQAEAEAGGHEQPQGAEAPFSLSSEVAEEPVAAEPEHQGPSKAYLEAKAKADAISAEYRQASQAYRAREIDDATFLEARKRYTQSEEAFDRAFAEEEQRGNEQPQEPDAEEPDNPIMELARAINEAPKVADVPFSLEREAVADTSKQNDLFASEKPSFGKWQAMQLPPKPKRSGGFQSTLIPGAKEFAEQDLAPIVEGGKNMALEARNRLAPQGASEPAQESADVVRRAKARIANADAVEQYRMVKVTKAFAKQSDAANIANIAEYERTGQFANAPEGYSEFYKKSMTQAGRLLERAYGRNVVGRVENYVRRAFKFGSQADEVKGTDYLTTKLNSLSANKSPLKHRVLDMPLDEALADMRARGINVKPATTNPELLRQWSIGNARQAIAYREAWDDLKGRGLVKYVRSFTRPPEGMVPLEDRVATVFKSPLLPVDEANDAGVMDGLRGVAEKLGVKLSRSVQLEGAPRSAGGGSVWGLSGPGNRVQTKFAGSESILAHEIGHQIDDKFGLWNKLKALETQYKAEGYENWSLAKQLRAVTDLTWEGQPEPPDTYQRYNRSAPEKMANLVSAYVHAPEKLKRVAPDVFNIFDEIVDTSPALHGLREIEPGIRLETNQGEVHAGGHVVAGQYYATPDVARILNNSISTGFENSPTFRGLRALNNSMNQLQLGISGFHATGTALNAGISDLALGVRKIGRGDFSGGGAAIARGLVPGVSFARDLWNGRKLIEGLKNSDPAAFAVLNDVINPSGARLRIEQRYANQAVENMRTAYANGNVWGTIGRAPMALVEAAAKPLMQYAIPRVKLGALLDLAADIKERNPGNLDQVSRARELAKASDSIDNRFGQLVYDNLFWKKTTTDLAQLATRSVGWNLGTIRELGGGVMDARKLAKGEVTDRLLYTAALPLYVGAIGAMYQYLHTGKGPEEVKDYFYPKNGRTEPNGMESRTTLPTYMKDVEAYGVPEYAQGKLQEGVGKTMATLAHKQSPLLEFSRNLIMNEDYFGDMIRNPDDPAMKQFEQLGKYALKEIMPFSVQQYARSKDENATPEAKAESFLGFVKAPATMERTPAETLMHSFIGPQPSRTPEQVDKSNLKRELRNDVKKGDTAAAQAIINRGQLGRRQVMDAAKNAHVSGLQLGFKKLTLDQAIRVYEVGSTKERGLLRPILERKVRALRDAAPEDIPDLQQRLTKAGSLPYDAPPIMATLAPAR